MRPLVLLAQAPVHAYRLLIAPILVPSCRYLPSCSAYALEALERHGVWRGGVMALGRLLRCHPVRWLGGSEGFDPVPPKADATKCLAPQASLRHTHASGPCQHRASASATARQGS